MNTNTGHNTLEIQFPSESPINAAKLGGQNKRLYDYLAAGNTIHVFDPAKRQLRIGYLNSVVSSLRNTHRVKIYSKFITVKDLEGVDTTVKIYSMTQHDSSWTEGKPLKHNQI